MHNTGKIKIGISIGDPNGIGIELLLKAFEDKRLYDFFTPLVFADFEILKTEQKKFSFQTALKPIKWGENLNKSKLNVLSVAAQSFSVEYGKVSESAGQFAIRSLEEAVKALQKNKVDVLVTLPIHKQAFQLAGFKYPGHTDYLNEKLQGDSLMFMVHENLRVALVTDHIPIQKVAQALSEDLLRQKIDSLLKSLKEDFGINKPKIALLGLNPHTGDQGVIGTEDDDLIRPVINAYFNKGDLVFGPYAADGFFGSKHYQAFDAVLAMYHDQGLIPFKTLAFGSGVNFTAGLEKIRTSPDHGTGFDIAGKKKADRSSFIEALFLARKVYANRSEMHQEEV